MPLDVAFTSTPTGRLSFARKDGDLFLDDKCVYAVIATLCSIKGRYGWDSSVGTWFTTIKKDGRLTGTRLSAAATDALDQVRAELGITPRDPQADRLSGGRWQLQLRWRSVGKDVSSTRNF